MNLELRLAALSKLIDVISTEADNQLDLEFVKVRQVLQQSVVFDELMAALKTLQVLAPRFHAATVPLAADFARAIGSKSLTHGEGSVSASLSRYQTASVLIRETIEAVERIRYVQTEDALDFFLELSNSDDSEILNDTQRAINRMAEFDIGIFYDLKRGPEPQVRIVNHLSKLPPEKLASYCGVILHTLASVLSSAMQGTSSTYDRVVISRGTITSSYGVAEMRADAIALLKKMYFLSNSVGYRKSTLRSMLAATRREAGPVNDDTQKMFVRDALEVATFFQSLIATEAMPLLQVIEHDAYWQFYFHASSSEVESAGLTIRDTLAAHSEYQIYKLLIGFEGIFGKWEDLKRSESAWDYTDNHRHAAAKQFVSEINAETIDQWRKRILEFSKTESDDLATFPVYYQFLQGIGREHPAFAFELVTEHEDVMRPFLIALVRGLWNSSYLEEIEVVVDTWIKQSKHLISIAKSLFDSEPSLLPVLSNVLRQSISVDDRRAIVESMEVAASLYGQGTTASKNIFMEGMRALASKEDASWAHEMWHSREFRSLINDVESRERVELLAALGSLKEIDYQAEEILTSIAEHDPQAVITYLVGRLVQERKFRESHSESGAFDRERYEAIPFQLYKLHKELAKQSEAVIAALRKDFDAEEPAFFQFRGARLVKGIFPEFGEPLETHLRKLVDGGSLKDVDFVLDILRTYEGSSAIQDLCKAIVKVVPERSEHWNELAVAIESTGVVSGEYGFVEAYQRKRAEIGLWKNDDNARIRAFADWLVETLDRMIVTEKQRADEGLALRKYKFGVSDEDS